MTPFDPDSVEVHHDGMVTLTQARFDELMRYERELLALQDAGVDNWGEAEYAREDCD